MERLGGEQHQRLGEFVSEKPDLIITSKRGVPLVQHQGVNCQVALSPCKHFFYVVAFRQLFSFIIFPYLQRSCLLIHIVLVRHVTQNNEQRIDILERVIGTV